jgi:hypothetical protein
MSTREHQIESEEFTRAYLRGAEGLAQDIPDKTIRLFILKDLSIVSADWAEDQERKGSTLFDRADVVREFSVKVRPGETGCPWGLIQEPSVYPQKPDLWEELTEG